MDIRTTEKLPERFGKRVDVELNFDLDRRAIAFGLKPHKGAAVLIEPLAHLPERVRKVPESELKSSTVILQADLQFGCKGTKVRIRR